MENLPTRQRLMLIYGKTHIPLEQATADWLPHISEKNRPPPRQNPNPPMAGHQYGQQSKKQPIRQSYRHRRLARPTRTAGKNRMAENTWITKMPSEIQTALYFSIALLGIFQRLNKIQPSRAAAYIGINPHTFPIPV